MGWGADGDCRFLRARKFDLAKAKEMLLAMEQWRKDFGVDDIVKCALPVFPLLIFRREAATQKL